MTRLSETRLAEAIRTTMDTTGWTAAADLVLDTTARRLAGDDETAYEAVRKDLDRVWGDRFEIRGAC